MPRWMPLPRPWISRTSRRPGLVRGVHVLLDDRLDVARREGVQIERVLDRASGAVTARGIGRGDDRLDAAADREVADDRHAAGLAGGDQVVEDLVGHRLVEDAAVAELDQVVLQRLQLDTAIAGDVGDADLAEVRQAGLGADRGELGAVDRDLEVASGPGIRKCLDRRRA